MQTVIDTLRHWAEVQPDKTLYTYRNVRGEIVDSLTYRQLECNSNYLASRLSNIAGIEKGRPVLLSYSPGLPVIVSFLACVKIGALPVPIPPLGPAGGLTAVERLGAVAADSGAQSILADRRQQKILSETIARTDSKAVPLDAVAAAGLNWVDTFSMSGALDDYLASPHETLFLQYTSGSTRAPRGVVVTHDNVIHNCPTEPDASLVGVSWLPHFHDMGLIGYYLFPLLRGGTAHFFSSLDFMRRPALWLQTITDVRATHTSAPDFAFDYCLRDDKLPDETLNGLDLSSLVDIMSASEPARCSVLDQFQARFKRCGLDPHALTVAYGLAEHTLRVSVGGRVRLAFNKDRLAHGQVNVVRGQEARVNAVDLASCGFPVDGVDLRIVDPDLLTEMPAGVTGEIWVAGPSKAQGYWNHPEQSQSIFGARLADAPDATAYLRTGDSGFVHDGELFICGRIRDMVILHGKNVFPTDVESAIEKRFPDLEAGRVAVFGWTADAVGESGLIVLVEARKGGTVPPLSEIHRMVVTAFSVPVKTVAHVRRGSIAKTSSGKIARHRCQRAFQNGELTTIAEFSPDGLAESEASLEDVLDGLVFRIGGVSGDETTISELGLDSIELVELSIRLEQLAQRHGVSEEQRQNTVYDMRLLQAATVGQVKQIARALSAGSLSPDLAAGALESAMHDIVADEAHCMREDTVLDSSLNFRPASCPTGGEGPVIVTGANGFLGCFLIESLLRLTSSPLIAMVRAQNPDHARTRLQTALLQTGMNPKSVDEAMRTRIQVVCGNLTAPNMGLSDEEWDQLSRQVSTVYHCAANVDYIKPYGELRQANVFGTAEVIRFCATERPKVLNYISTTFIFGWTTLSIKGEDERNGNMEWLDFGYPQSKWAAEQLVYKAADQGLTVRVFRPSLVTASQSGHYMRGDISSRVIGYAIRKGVSLSAENQLSFLPVDVCANNIVAIAKMTDSANGTFHLTAGSYYTMETVCRLITDRFGYHFNYLDFHGFVEHINSHCDESDDLFALKPFFNNSREKFKEMEATRYDSQNYQYFCAKTADTQPEPALVDTVSWLVGFLHTNGLIPPPTKGELSEEPFRTVPQLAAQ